MNDRRNGPAPDPYWSVPPEKLPEPPPYAPMPRRPEPFISEAAEVEIRRNVERHHWQINEIEKLKTDVDHWRHRAELAEAEITVLVHKLKEQEDKNDTLKNCISTLHAQFETGAQIWLQGYETMGRLNLPHVKVITPPELQALDHKPEEK